jgi:hypothetical protein
MTYSITVKNKSGTDHSYLLVNRAPVIKDSSKLQDRVSSHILNTLHVPSGMAERFNISQQHIAVMGRGRNRPWHGDKVALSQTQTVKLTPRNHDGTVSKPGTKLVISKGESGNPVFRDETPSHAGWNEEIGTFSVEIPKDTLTDKDAAGSEPLPI